MGKILNAWKSSAKFRRWFVIIVISIILLSMYVEKKDDKVFVSQAVCDQALTKGTCVNNGCYWVQKGTTKDTMLVKGAGVTVGTILGGAAVAGGLQGCTVGSFGGPLGTAAGCTIGFATGATAGFFASGAAENLIGSTIDFVGGLFTSPCYSCVPDGFMAGKNTDCCSGYAKTMTVSSVTGFDFMESKIYQCYTPPPGETCSSWSRPISSMVDSIWKDAPNTIPSCNGRAFVGIGVLLFVVLVI